MVSTPTTILDLTYYFPLGFVTLMTAFTLLDPEYSTNSILQTRESTNGSFGIIHPTHQATRKGSTRSGWLPTSFTAEYETSPQR